MITKILQLQKRDSYVYQNIQDKAAWNTFNHVYALADGTTQSINSERWAAMITEDFVAKPTFNSKEIIDLFTDTARKFSNENYSFSSNPAIAALEKAKISKGASTTFLGLQFLQNNYVNVISCGDTNLFLIDNKGHLINCFPFNTVKAINTNNSFINTTQLTEQKIDASYFRIKKIRHTKNNIFIMATDALSRLFLKKPETIREVMKINNFDMLYNFCLKYWDKKELEEDDISAIVIFRLHPPNLSSHVLSATSVSHCVFLHPQHDVVVSISLFKIHKYGLVSNYQLNAQFLYSITIYMLHYKLYDSSWWPVGTQLE